MEATPVLGGQAIGARIVEAGARTRLAARDAERSKLQPRLWHNLRAPGAVCRVVCRDDSIADGGI